MQETDTSKTPPSLDHVVMHYAEQLGKNPTSVQITLDEGVAGWFLRGMDGRYGFVDDKELPKFEQRPYQMIAGLIIKERELYITNTTGQNLVLIAGAELRTSSIISPSNERKVFSREHESKEYNLMHSLRREGLGLSFKREKPKSAFEYDELWKGIEDKLKDLTISFGSLINPEKEMPWERFEPTLSYFKAKENKPETPYLREFMGKLWGIPVDKLKEYSLHDLVKGYIAAYIRTPIATIQRENTVLTENTKLPTNWLVNFLVGFHRDIENTLFQTEENHVSKNPDRFEELHDVWFLASGDYLPGGDFILGDPKTYIRELLRMEGESPLVRESLIQAKLTAISHARQGKLSLEKTAEQIFIDFQKLYSDKQEGIVYANQTIQSGKYMEDGGSCRHRSAQLAQALQEAGFFAQYTRQELSYGRHATVFIYTKPGEFPAIHADPNMESEQYKKQGLDRGIFSVISEAYKHALQKPVNTIWRARV